MNQTYNRRKTLGILAAVVLTTTHLKLSATAHDQGNLDAFADIEVNEDAVRQLLDPLWSSKALPTEPGVIEKSLALKSSTIGHTELVRLRQQIAFDYISGNTLKTRGWILSSTEAKLWALYVLTHE